MFALWLIDRDAPQLLGLAGTKDQALDMIEKTYPGYYLDGGMIVNWDDPDDAPAALSAMDDQELALAAAIVSAHCVPSRN